MPRQNSDRHEGQSNPLLKELHRVHIQISYLKDKTKIFYFRVLLSRYPCPKCNGELTMTGENQCSCSCGEAFDPTLAFQKSACCAVKLIRKTFHYVCSRCKKANPSRFLFDERIFDRAYFCEMMKASRAKAKKKKEEMIKLLMEARSGELPLLQDPCLESIPGLIADLDHFVGADEDEADYASLETNSVFSMDDYRSHILSALDCGSRFFSKINNLGKDHREDKVYRFVTLIFMQNDQEVELTQYDNDLLIEKLET
jgi:hypothetical protein